MYDTIIIGMGCAGMSAGVYAKRSGLRTLIIDENAPGGLLNKVNIVENYLGFKSISGPDLALTMFEHINNEQVPYKIEKVLKIELKDGYKEITTTKSIYQTKSIILAIGRKPKKSGLALEDKYVGKGISYCALCDGALYKNKDIVVLGGGSSAFEEAIYLSNIASSVKIIVRSEIKAEKALYERAIKINNIEIIKGRVVSEFIGNELIEAVKLDNDEIIKCEGVFIYYGYDADTAFINDLKITNEKGYIDVDQLMRTKVPFIYACGDIIQKDLYQIITATSEGAIAATSARKDLMK